MDNQIYVIKKDYVVCAFHEKRTQYVNIVANKFDATLEYVVFDCGCKPVLDLFTQKELNRLGIKRETNVIPVNHNDMILYVCFKHEAVTFIKEFYSELNDDKQYCEFKCGCIQEVKRDN